ncbi:MAG: signal recognition particle protein [Candidatus Ancillula trichonymphae]|jgi:signal recognition particle subunit SRP54|nr:signal recognition particle protein [Candidatus Ancillula trichonymphae]
MLDSISGSLLNSLKKLRGKGAVSRADVDAVLADIRIALLNADVAVSVVDEFVYDVRKNVADIELSKKIKPHEQIVKVVSDELEEILGKDVERPLRRAKSNPTVYMLIGLQGTGKTTLAGKLGYYLKKNGHTPLLVAADLQRPGAVSQLKIVGESAGVPVFAPHEGVGEDEEDNSKKGLFFGLFSGRDSSNEPVNVAKQSVEYAKQKLFDTIIIDTAGRLGVDEELMKQASRIKQAVQPDEVLFVLDATTGQDAINSARAFNEGVGFTGAVLSKLDSDTRGGAALSVVKVIGNPIMFASVGERFKDLEVFYPDRLASRILDQGDILVLIEKAKEAFDEEQVAQMLGKITSGKSFDLNDYLAQLEQVQKIGSIKQLAKMIPGMGKYKEAIVNFDESKLTKTAAVIRSMTPFERANPRVINGSRRARISKGSGVEVSSGVNAMLKEFDATSKMMKHVLSGASGTTTKGGLSIPNGMNLPGGFDMSALTDQLPSSAMGGFPGAAPNRASGRRAKNKKKIKGKSGNPAVRAQQEEQLRRKLGV